MSVFLDKSRKIKAININKILRKVLSDKVIQETILDFNRKDQLFLKGEDAEGVKLGDKSGGYSPTTIQLSIEEKGSAVFNYKGASSTKTVGGSPILFNDGDFYDTFKINIGSNYFTITANPIKDNNNLFDDFGANIVGLQQESKNKLTDLIKDVFISTIKREATK